MRVRLTVIALRVSQIDRSWRRPAGPASALAATRASACAIGYVPALTCGSVFRRRPPPGEHRVALVPEVVSKLQGAKASRCSCRAAPATARCSPTPPSREAGADDRPATPAEVWGSDVVVKIAPPDPRQIAALGSGSILIGFLAPLTSPQTTRALAEQGATAFAMEAIPRISRAQSMDALPRRATSPATRPRCSAPSRWGASTRC